MRGAITLSVIVALASTGVAAKPRRSARPPNQAYVLHISSHLAEDASVVVDKRSAVTAPGYGSTETPIAAGAHAVTVTSPDGVNYTEQLALDPARAVAFEGRRYWCVNLLESALQRYSQDECDMEVRDRG